MADTEATIPPPSSPVTKKINLWILGIYFDWFVKKYLPAYVPVITSSLRDPDKNEAVGGVSNSAHLFGLAYDFVLRFPDGSAVPKAQAKKVFENFILPNWHGFALWEEDAKGVWHIHVNLTRQISEYAGIMGLAAIGVLGFHFIHSIGEQS